MVIFWVAHHEIAEGINAKDSPSLSNGLDHAITVTAWIIVEREHITVSVNHRYLRRHFNRIHACLLSGMTSHIKHDSQLVNLFHQAPTGTSQANVRFKTSPAVHIDNVVVDAANP